MPDIHFYDTDSGYIHYVSEVVPGLECRVFDAIRNESDVFINPELAVQFIPELYGNNFTDHIQSNAKLLADECVKVSNKGLKFMDQLMTNSPIRDGKKWVETHRAEFMLDRANRRKLWKS